MSVAHDQVNQHIFDIQLDFLGFEVVQPHGRVPRQKAAWRFSQVPRCSKTLPSDLV